MIDISKEIMEKLERGCSYEFESAICENVVAKTKLVLQDGSILISSRLYTQIPVQKIKEVPPQSTRSRNINVLPYDIRNIHNALASKYIASINSSKKRDKKSNKEFPQRVYDVPGILCPENYSSYVAKGWGEGTTKQAVSYFANTIGKIYELYGDDATRVDFEEFREKEVERIYKANFQRPCKDGTIVTKRREQIYMGVNQRFKEARVIQQYLLDNYPGEWPETKIPVLGRYAVGKFEEIKSIGYERYIKFCVLLVRCCEIGIPHAFAAAGEALCGERIGESCAPLIGDFERQGDIGRYYVEYQIDKYGNRTNILKNPQSYRYVFFGNLMNYIIDLRIKQLMMAGVDTDAMENMPFAAKLSEPYTFLRKETVSSFIRELLVLCGCDEDWIRREAERLFVASVVTGTDEDLDVSAHILRRTLATVWGNGGVHPDDVDAVLGHKNEKNLHKSFASWRDAKRIFGEITRSFHFGSMVECQNPAYCVNTISSPCKFRLHGNSKYSFHCETDLWVDVDLVTLEGNDAVYINVPKQCSAKDFLRREVPDTCESRESRPILPRLPAESDIEKWIADARLIDISKIIKRYGEEEGTCKNGDLS